MLLTLKTAYAIHVLFATGRGKSSLFFPEQGSR